MAMIASVSVRWLAFCLLAISRNDAAKQPGAASAPLSAVAAPVLDGLRESLQNHLRRARELAAQGKWAEAGKEQDALEVESRK
jgi:hypothetical protein